MPNSDFSEFRFSDVVNVGTEPTDMYTQKRVNQFVSDYHNFKETEVKNTTADPQMYRYYHFVASPQAITSTSLGTIASSLCLTDNGSNCMLQPYRSPNGAPELNTPDGHTMNLMKEYNDYLKPQSEKIKKFVPTEATLDISDSIMQSIQQSNTMAFDPFIDLFANMPPISNTGVTKSYGVEVFAYLQFPALGDYRFSFSTDTTAALSTFFAWIGDSAPIEYMIDNSTMNINKGLKDVVFTVTDNRKVPIRLQYYCVPSSTSTSSSRRSQEWVLQNFKMMDASKNNVTLALYSSTTTTPFIYPPLYAAFTSALENSFISGQFKCFTNFNSLKSQDYKFYDVIRKKKRDILLYGLYDRDLDGTKEVAVLPPLSGSKKTYYTQNNTQNAMQLPNVFSLYRFSIDRRYDTTYQITTKPFPPYNNHSMVEVDDTLLAYSGSFSNFPGYLPLNPTQIQDLSAAACKNACIDSPASCSYYYTYTTDSGQKAKCVLDTKGDFPIFNHVRSGDSSSEIDVGSGTLSLRNKQLKMDANGKVQQCAESIAPEVVATTDYTRNFKYSKYDLSSASLTNMDDLGTCGSAKYKSFVGRARDILRNTHEYRSDGQWKSNNLQWNSVDDDDTTEGLASKNTTAVNDTIDSIKSNQNNHDRLRQKMIGINERDQDLRKTMQAYHGMSSYMNREARYDHNGNMLLYLRAEPPPPTLTQLNANDSQLLSNQQTLLFYTGVITAATLIVLAVTMASE